MAFSTQRVVSDGTLVLLDVSIDYFDRDEISVFFDGIIDALPWSWVGTTESKISFSPAVPLDVEVLLRRNTELGLVLHEFQQGAAFTEQSMDENFAQMLRIAQEAKEGGTLGDIFNDLDMHGFQIQNVAPATQSNHVVTLAQFSVHDATIIGYRDQAAASAGAAATSASNAATSAANAAAAVTAREPFLLDRTNHTGTQAISTVTGLQTALDGKVGQTGTTGAALLPAGTTAQRPTGAQGHVRFNTTLNSFEGYSGTTWGALGGGATGGAGNAAFYENDTNITVDYTLTSGKNAMSAGPITVNTGITVTVPTGSVWTIV